MWLDLVRYAPHRYEEEAAWQRIWKGTKKKKKKVGNEHISKLINFEEAGSQDMGIFFEYEPRIEHSAT